MSGAKGRLNDEFSLGQSYRKTPRLSILVLGNFLGGRTEMLTFELS
eukprot:COSAG04_NODE_3036_length_3250_cov_1.947636_1_plen_46_part_00